MSFILQQTQKLGPQKIVVNKFKSTNFVAKGLEDSNRLSLSEIGHKLIRSEARAKLILHKFLLIALAGVN